MHEEKSILEIDIYGTKMWRNAKGQLHRLDGPASEWVNGSKKWYKDGRLHRLDGPAVVFFNGYIEWRIEGKLHREDGPAVVFAGGNKQWWLNDYLYQTKEDWFDALSNEGKAKCLFSEDFLNG